MSQPELKSALVRSIIIEYHNAKTPGFMSWGHDVPPSMFVARKNRLRLAALYSRKYEPVSRLLFQNKLPSGNNWQGTSVLVSSTMHEWVNGVWSHTACTVPFEHCRGK